MTAPQGPGDLATLNKGDGSQKNWFEQAAGRGSSWIGTAQDLHDASSPPEWGAATFSARAEQLETLMNPGKALMDNGLGFLVSIVLSPLVELAEFAVGDPEQMRATGKGWENVAKWLDEVAEQEAKRAQATAQSWIGKDGDAFRKQMAEFSDGVKALADDVRELKETLESWADIIDMFVEFFVQVVTELVIGLIVQWLAALAASWITAGASVGAASAGTAVEVGATGLRITMRITQLQRKLFQLFQKVEHLLQKLREAGKLRKVIEKMNKYRDGNFVQKAVARKLDSHASFKFLTKADENTLASKGGKFLQDVEKQHGGALRDLDEQIKNAGEDRELKEALQEQRDRLAGQLEDAKDVQKLASGVSGHVLSKAMGGTTDVKLAARHVGMDMAKDAALEEGANRIYDTGKGWFQGDLSDDQRKQTEERGFR